MNLNFLDYSVFIAFILIVMGISLWASRNKKTSEDYFLAGRDLKWWLIGISLIASNISTEQFIGQAGKGYDIGLAIASYEWMAAVTLVVVAWFFLPKFLKCGIFTMPQFLEFRYSSTTRTIMAFFIMLAYIFVALATVLYSSALAFKEIFGFDIAFSVWLIGIIAAIYTIFGGLKAVVWSDLIQGLSLIAGGAIVSLIALNEIGGIDNFLAQSADKLHTVMPFNHPELPWVAVFIGGLWIPNLFYWGMNQFITQRTLGAKNLGEAQKGIFLAASIKLILPFIIIMPGIMAYQLYSGQITNPDQAYPYLINNLVPAGIKGFILAALFGAVVSTIDSLLNSASTIFTMDFYKAHFKKDATQKQLINVGRIVTTSFIVFGCFWAPIVGSFGSIFDYIQKFWGFITPGIVTAFVMGMVFKKIPPIAANIALVLGIPIYGGLLFFLPEVAFLHHMAFTFLILASIMLIIGYLKPLKEPVVFPVSDIDVTVPKSTYILGTLIILATAALYIIFW